MIISLIVAERRHRKEIMMYKKKGVFWCKLSIPGSNKRKYFNLGKEKNEARFKEATLKKEIADGSYIKKRIGNYVTVTQLLDVYENDSSLEEKFSGFSLCQRKNTKSSTKGLNKKSKKTSNL